MEDLRNIYQKNNFNKKVKLDYYLNIILKNKYKIIITIIVILIFLKPVLFGSMIGQWINDFFGSIIKNINF